MAKNGRRKKSVLRPYFLRMTDYSSLIFRLKFDGFLTPFLANEFILSKKTLREYMDPPPSQDFKTFLLFLESLLIHNKIIRITGKGTSGMDVPLFFVIARHKVCQTFVIFT